MKQLASIASLVVLFDQITKWLVVRAIAVDQPTVVIDGFFQLVNWRNTGAAWGMLQGYNGVLALVSVVTVVALILFRRSLGVGQSGLCAATIALIIGGIIGNLIDRVRVGSVIDFLDFYIGDHHWPAFNVADSAICIGVALYVIASWQHDTNKSAPSAG